ncbi:MAG: response regulator, partial [Proteobacteria bacterium]|nr:response regulator [Pseudomonadota bacterium]
MENYVIIQCLGGEEALKAISDSEKPDLIILDVMMPMMSGYDVCKKIRETYSMADIPVLMLTAKNQIGDLIEGFDAGANDFLSKPIEREELLARIRSLVTLKQSEQELGYYRRLLRNIIDSMPSVVVGVDPEGLVTQWNHKAEVDTGVSVEKAVGQKLNDVFPILANEMDNVIKSIENREIHRKDKILSGTEEEPGFTDLIVFPLVANGIEGAVIRIDDVTKRVQLEAMVIHSEKMKMIGQMSSGIATEIKNPIGGIMQMAQNALLRISSDQPKNIQAAK